jgi:AcrR family transcriptional regulator
MGLVERRQREKDQRRDEIITAASRLFSKKGYEKVSMDEIANEVELSKSTLYFYFKDKDSLFLAVVNRGNKILSSLLTEEEKRIQNAGIKIGGHKDAWFRFIREYPEYARCRAYFRTERFGLESDTCKNDDEREILEFNKECFEKGVRDLKFGIEKGLYRSDLNPFLITALSVLLYDSLFTISPWLRNILNDNEITVQQFIMDSICYLDFFILSK